MIPEQVFDDHHKAVYRFVYRLVGRADLAEDITQECFLAVLRAPQRWDADRGGVKTYLFSIARNLAFKRYRDDHANVQVEKDLAASIADRRTDQELAAVVAQTVAQLPELQREVLPYPSRQSRSLGAAVLLQAAMVALLFAASRTQLVQKKIQAVTPIFFPQVYQPKLPTAAQKAAGGGGGGMHDSEPVSHGKAPQFAAKTFVPPALAIPRPKLPVVPTITAQAPQIEDAQYGDPLAKLTELSGSHGLGNDTSGGVGHGFGDGAGGGQGGGAFKIGGDVSAPILVAKVEPEYSEEARKAKYSGTVLLSIVVDVNGMPRNIHVVRPLGLGLDEKAVAAVQKWRFRPGTKGGRPVATVAQVEVNFRLL